MWPNHQAAMERTFVRAIALFAVLIPVTAPAQVPSAASRSVVQVIDPSTIAPTIGAAPWNANGPAVSRRAVTHAGQGAHHLDIGYNTYKKGTKLSTPYAYKTDEFCFVPSGRISMQDEPTTYEAGPGRLMWRPAGALTRAVEFLEDTVTICSMSPARPDANSHRIPPQEVGRWSGDPATKPHPRWFPMTTAPLITSPDRKANAGVIEREVLSKRRDGSTMVSVTYTTFERGAQLASRGPGEEICWVESGSLSLSSNGRRQTARTGNFIFRPEGVPINQIRAATAASMVCFIGPPTL